MDKDLSRFYAKTSRATNGCLEWTGTRKGDSYGKFWCDGRMHTASRWIYQRLSDVVLEKTQVVMHKCDNPGCVNIDHLSVGTLSENSTDMVNKGRQVCGFGLGEAHYDSKLTAEKVLLIRASSETHASLSRAYGVSTTTIRNIRKRKIWKSV